MKHTVELIELSNGAKGLLIDVPDATVTSIDISFRAGDYLSPTGKMDTAHITEHLVLGANKRFKKASDFSQEFTKNGAYNNAYTGDYHMGYVAECADFETDRILDLLCAAIESPSFLVGEYKSEKANVREELKSRKNNHATELSLELEHELGFVPLAYSVRSTQLDGIDLEDIKNHYQKTHFSRNARFIIAGQMNKWRDTLLARLQNMQIVLGDAQIELPTEVPESLIAPVMLKNEGIDNVYYRWETAMPRLLTDQERHGLYTMQDMLFATFHSRIFGVARERGLIYGIGANAYRTGQNQVWFVQGQVLPENITPLFELITSQLEAVVAGEISNEEVEGVKQFGLGDFQRAFQTVGNLASWYGQSFVMDDIVRDFNEVPTFIANTNRDTVIEAARLLFRDSQWGLGFLAQKDQKLDTSALQNRVGKLYT